MKTYANLKKEIIVAITNTFNMKPRIDPDDVPYGYCSECKEKCFGVFRDMGIGPYEYWGTNYVDERWEWVSPCCEGEIMERLEDCEE